MRLDELWLSGNEGAALLIAKSMRSLHRPMPRSARKPEPFRGIIPRPNEAVSTLPAEYPSGML
jgi:hypothetical protein